MSAEAEHEARDLLSRRDTGKRAALAQLLEPQRERIWRLASRLTGSREDAEDVVQEAYLKAYQGLASFDSRADVGTWLWRIVVNTAMDLRRRQASRQGATACLNETPAPAPPGARQRAGAAVKDDPVERVARAEFHAALQAGLAALPEALRAALVLVAFEELSYAQAAKVLGCPAGTLAWRVAEGRRRLTERLRPFLGRGGEHNHEV